jgi:DNA-binding MarR family transcriptional regulator
MKMARPRQDLLALMHPVAKALRHIEDVAAAQHGLNMWQYAILSVVIETPGLNQAEVAKRLQYSVNRIIGDLDVLEDGGLLTRRTGDDRRVNLLEATTPGITLRNLVRADIHRREDKLLAGLTPTQRTNLYSALQHLVTFRTETDRRLRGVATGLRSS